MIRLFCRHGMMSDHSSMAWLASELMKTKKFCQPPDNKDYEWRAPVVDSGLELADDILTSGHSGKVLLVGHSQGGLVCRVAATALAGEPRASNEDATDQISEWQERRLKGGKFPGKLAVVSIATPNSGAMTFGQMSIAAELSARFALRAAKMLDGIFNLEDLMTPRLFKTLENWRVPAKHLSISAVRVNRYSRGTLRNLSELLPMERISVRLDLPNDTVVEDSSSDLRQSLIPPEIDVDRGYRHVRAYPGSVNLNHFNVRESKAVVSLITDSLDWLFE